MATKKSPKSQKNFHRTFFFLFLGVLLISILGLYGVQMLYPRPFTITTQTIKENSTAQNYLMNIQYPQLMNVTNSAKVNAQIAQMIKNNVDGFKYQVFQLNTKYPPSFPSSLTIEYQSSLITKNIVSVEFLIEDFSSGAANPTNTATTFNYDLDLGKELTVVDIFMPNTDFVTKVSTLTSDDLKKQFAKEDLNYNEFIKEGTMPNVENFRKFLLTKKSIIFVFDPAVVAPYAAGVRQVEIPFTQLKDILNSIYVH